MMALFTALTGPHIYEVIGIKLFLLFGKSVKGSRGGEKRLWMGGRGREKPAHGEPSQIVKDWSCNVSSLLQRLIRQY